VPARPLWTVILLEHPVCRINIVQSAIIIKERTGIRFTDEEKELHETLSRTLRPLIHELMA